MYASMALQQRKASQHNFVDQETCEAAWYSLLPKQLKAFGGRAWWVGCVIMQLSRVIQLKRLLLPLGLGEIDALFASGESGEKVLHLGMKGIDWRSEL